MRINKIFCKIVGHSWLISEHVRPIVTKFVKRSEYNHPLAYHRHGHYGYAEDWYAHPTKILSPLAGCKAACSRCGAEVNDTSVNDPIVVKLDPPVKFRSR